MFRRPRGAEELKVHSSKSINRQHTFSEESDVDLCEELGLQHVSELFATNGG